MTTDRSYDVAVVGGGPAGSAAALSLRAHAPGLSVVMVEASSYGAPRIGETLPPPAARLLAHLGVWDAFRAQGHCEVHGTTALWGSATPHENEFIFNAHGAGWHVDRCAFDAMLAAEAERRGAFVRRGTRLEGAARAGDEYHLRLSSGRDLRARVVLDATGPGACFARRFGARSVGSDRLVGLVRFYRGAEESAPRTLVEAFADGWWYSAALPGGRRVAACLTDTDIARRLHLGEAASWLRHLGATTHVRDLVEGAQPEGEIVVRAARSRRLSPAAGDDWLAVGDAASTFDPLSSQGILKALRSGIFASYATADLLVRGEAAGLPRYRLFVEKEYESFTGARAVYYAVEGRWPESPFWQRRRGTPAGAAPARRSSDSSFLP